MQEIQAYANSIPRLGRSHGEQHGTHSSILAWRIPMDRGIWQATVHGVSKSQTQLSDLHSIQNSLNIDLVIHASL